MDARFLERRETLNAVDFSSDASHGFAVGENGTILATTDGGANWSAQSEALPFDDTRGWAAGGDYLGIPGWFNGVTLVTKDGGGTWSEQDLARRLGFPRGRL